VRMSKPNATVAVGGNGSLLPVEHSKATARLEPGCVRRMGVGLSAVEGSVNEDV
jgi:hypothetical protein